MPVTYFLRAANSDLGGGTQFNKILQRLTEPAASLSVFVSQNSTSDSYGFTRPNNPGSEGGSGSRSFTANVFVETANAQITVAVLVSRITSIGTVASGPVALGLAQSAAQAGLLTFTGTADLGTFGPTDRFRVTYRFQNINALSSQTVVIRTGADTSVVAPWTLSPEFSTGTVSDADRDFTAGTQLISVLFTDPVKDDSLVSGELAPGHSIKIGSAGGIVYPATYISGSESSSWRLRIPVVARFGEAITYSYSRATGQTVSLDGTLEMRDSADGPIVNNLTKRIRIGLRREDDTVPAGETVKLWIGEYAGGNVSSGVWMARQQAQLATVNSLGVIDVQYVGSVAVGGLVYAAVIRTNAAPSESMLWTLAIE